MFNDQDKSKEEQKISGKPKRRAWKRPELTVLVRSKPEEAVLQACKQYDEPFPGPYEEYDFCMEICAWECYMLSAS
jgi:hypothetical protein